MILEIMLRSLKRWECDWEGMITSVFLFATGIAAGCYYRLWVILFASGCVVAAYIAACVIQWRLGWLEFLILFAHLSALQGGFLLAQYLRPRS